jgi:hypothetical protein
LLLQRYYGSFFMNLYKRKAVILRQNMARSVLFSVLGDPDAPESQLEELFRMYKVCTSFTIIKYLYRNGYISQGKCAGMIGCSLRELHLYYDKYLYEGDEDESYFGI